MNATEAVTKIKLLLGLQEEVTETFAQVKLVDGSIVETEGEFEAGKSCFVVTGEEKIPAPAGIHQSEEGMLITVDESGVITSIEEMEEEVEAEEEVKETEVAMEEEESKEETLEEEKETVEMEEEEVDMVMEIVTALKPFMDNLDELKEKVQAMEEKYESFAKAPAAKPIKRVSEDFEANKMDRVNKIAKLRNNK
jgi:hypothetical protein